MPGTAIEAPLRAVRDRLSEPLLTELLGDFTGRMQHKGKSLGESFLTFRNWLKPVPLE
jgi:hypothetical protein